jgi:hypothetical protein
MAAPLVLGRAKASPTLSVWAAAAASRGAVLKRTALLSPLAW